MADSTDSNHESTEIVEETSSSNVDDYHRKCLSELCRICNKVLKPKDRCFEIYKHIIDLKETHKIDFSKDKIDIHPTKFCFTCYGSINNFKKRGTIPTYEVSSWFPHTEDGCMTCVLRDKKGKGGRPVARKGSNFGRPKNTIDIRDVMKLDKNSQISPSLQKAASHILALTVKKSPGEMVKLQTGGPNPLTLMPVTVARKESQNVSKRTLRARTQQLKEVTSIVAGGSKEGVSSQRAHLIKSLDEAEREEILKLFKTSVSISADVVASMKSTLGLPWNLIRDVRRWLKTFKVSFAAEGKVRTVVKDWVGTGLKSEELPAHIIINKKITIKLKPWCYIFNLVGYVLHYLDNLSNTKLLIDVPFIPDDKIYLKIGGDHGGGSFKMSFQIANVENPNKPENTVIFSILEAKDHKANLNLCLERFKAHVAQFSKVKWNQRTFDIFLFGDYEFLCTMYGLSGASGRHPCLWCHITKASMQVSPKNRVEVITERTLDTLKCDLEKFEQVHNSNVGKAKLVNNVISDIFFDIPLINVCVPGLHITLGVYLKMLHEFQHFAKKLDVKIAELLVKEKGVVNSDELKVFVDNLNVIIEGEKSIVELVDRRNLIMEELSWFALNQDEDFNDEYYNDLLQEINDEINVNENHIENARRLTKEFDSGPCFSSIDATLEKMGIEMAKYFGGTLVGNDCHKLLQSDNISTLCKSMITVVCENVDDEELRLLATEKMEEFESLFTKYANCHNIFNSSRYLFSAEIDELEDNITEFMDFLRSTFPEISISPKLHMLESHIILFIRKWSAGCGFFGEQGGESIHSKINNLKRTHGSVQNQVDRLKSIMQCHLSSTNPNARVKRVYKKPRNLKRKMVE